MIASRLLSGLRSRVPSRALSALPAETRMMGGDPDKPLGFAIDEMSREGVPAYLDVQATSQVDPRVLDAMLPYLVGSFGNAHSKTHSFGLSLIHI